MSNIFVSSPGKLILHGEHAVVYGKKAIATSLNLRTFLQIQTGGNQVGVHVLFPDIQMERKWNIESLSERVSLPICTSNEPKDIDSALLGQLKTLTNVPYHSDTKHLALIAFLYLYFCLGYDNGKLPGIRIEIKSRLPTGAGLGSSAAFSSCLAAGLLIHRKLIANTAAENGSSDAISDGTATSTSHWSKSDLDLINKWAFQAERIIHGNPSGIDNSVSVYGGALSFCKGDITPLASLPAFRIILFNTKQPRSTKQLVANVKEKYTKYPDIVAPVLCSIEAIVEKCLAVLANQQSKRNHDDLFKNMNDLVAMNQNLLEFLDVSHPKLQRVCDIARRHGLCAKLTGAGGGGCAFALLPVDCSKEVIQECITEAQSAGFDAWETSIGGRGVSQHFSSDNSMPF